MGHTHGDGQMYVYGPAGGEKGQEAACGKHATERACALVNKRRRGGGCGKYGKRPARKPARGKGVRGANAERAGVEVCGGKIGGSAHRLRRGALEGQRDERSPLSRVDRTVTGRRGSNRADSAAKLRFGCE